MCDCAAIESHRNLKQLGSSPKRTTSQIRLIHANCFDLRTYKEAVTENLSLIDTNG